MKSRRAGIFSRINLCDAANIARDLNALFGGRVDIEKLVNEGDIQNALEAITGDVKAAPAAAAPRIALFQLLSVNGQWERAAKQLTVLQQLDDEYKLLVQSYGALLTCELFRQEVFAGKHVAPILGEPEQWMVLALEALKADCLGRHEQASELRNEAFDGAPALAGSINDNPFDWLADADPRIGPFFEIMVRGDYYWVPQSRIESLALILPKICGIWCGHRCRLSGRVVARRWDLSPLATRAPAPIGLRPSSFPGKQPGSRWVTKPGPVWASACMPPQTRITRR